jgi:hypothetical protein
MNGEKIMFYVRFDPKVTPIEVAAERLCNEERELLGVDDSNVRSHCIDPVTSHISDLIA